MDRKKVLVVGGGAIGQAVWVGLNSLHEYDIKVIDSDPNHRWEDLDWFEHVDDFFVTPTKYLRDVDYLVMAVPVYDPTTVVALVHDCLQFGVHYVDFSEDVVIRSELANQFEDMDGIMIAQGCGLAPGMVQVLAQKLTEQFDEVHDINMYVGSLPMSASNSLYYHPLWSVDGVVNEYTKPVTTIEDGVVTVRNPLEWDQSEDLVVAGTEYEAFNTSGGLGTMIDTWCGEAKRVSYKTIRYLGHMAEVKRLLRTSEDDILHLRGQEDYYKDDLRAALMAARPIIPLDDRVLMHIEVTGVLNGEPRCNIYTKDIRSSTDIGRTSAIQRTTAGGAIAVIEAQRKYGFTGLIRQERYYREIMEQSGILVWAGYYG